MRDQRTPTVAAPTRDRDATAEARDKTAISHDETAEERDVLSEQRDERAVDREDASGDIDRDAKADRGAARRDRLSARGDRGHARDDREAASLDRSLAADEQAELLLDELTGCYRRAAGFLELEREIMKAERTDQPFVLAFLDVDGLKAVNDEQGHEAGDDLLREVVRCWREVLRSYDVFIRYGGDEFICGVADLPVAAVAERFETANNELRSRDHASVSVGLAERVRGEGLAALIERADAAMYEARERRTAESQSQVADTPPPV